MATKAKPASKTAPKAKRLGARRDPSKKSAAIAHVRTKGVDTSVGPSDEAGDAIDPNKPLTAKQKLFVQFWAQGESILSASVKAGYNDGGTYAYRLVRYPNVLRIYEEEKRLYAESCQMTRKQVMDGFIESIELAKLMAEPATMVSGWREVAKMCGYYEPVKRTLEVSVTGQIFHERLNRLSDAELFKLVQQGVQAERDQEEVLADGDEEDDDQ